MKRLSLLLLLCLLPIHVVFGQWNSDSTKNTLVCNAGSQQSLPKVATDRNNESVVVWMDARNSGYGQIYAQKFNADGVRQWQENGIRICSTGFVQRNPIVCSDGNGGAYIVWQDDRNPTTKPDLYAQHVAADGTLNYGAAGKSLAKVEDPSSSSSQKNWVITSDGRGGAFVAWEDYRTSISPSTSRPDIYMSKLGSGSVAWEDYGLPVMDATSRQVEPYLIPDTLGGCFLVYSTNYPSMPYGIGATRIGSDCSVLWGTGSTPNIIYRNSNNTQNSQNPHVMKYGGMYFLAWEEYQGSSFAGWDILAQRLSNNGTPAWFLPATMTPSSPGDQTHAIPNTDYAGGMQVVYEDYQGNKSISSSRVLANGATYKPSNPIYSVCNLGNDQRNPMAVYTEKGMMVFWEDERKMVDTSSIYGQVIDTTPVRQYPVAGSRWGFPVSTDEGSKHSIKDQMDIAPRQNGAIVVWRDGRNYDKTNFDIYMQIVFKNSTLPVELADFRLSRQLANAVRIDWQTAMENDNAGFEIERRPANGISETFEVIASYKSNNSLRGTNASSTLRSYSYLDLPASSGKYQYRLVDYNLAGERTEHAVKEIELGASEGTSEWMMLSVSPNPFRDRTTVSFIAPCTAVIDLAVVDQLGRVVASPLKGSTMGAGAHTAVITQGDLRASGTYYYYLTARDAETGSILYMSKPDLLNLTR